MLGYVEIMIKISDLTLFDKYKNLRLKIPDLKLYSPGITALIGQNGAGKSSLLRVIAGLEKASFGSIKFENKEIYINYEEIKQSIHLISWGVELYRNLSAIDHLNLFRAISQNWNQLIENDILKDLAIPLSKRVEKMSRGEQVRLRLLLSLPRLPKVILIDEVTNELDSESRRAIFKKLDFYSFETGSQIIVATNMIEDIERYATDIVLLKKGKVILHSLLDTIKESHNICLEEIIKIYEHKEINV